MLVWDLIRKEVVQRYVFDQTARFLGFREDGRLVVHAGDALFALMVGPGEDEPELLASRVRRAWMEHGDVGWMKEGQKGRPPVRAAERPQDDVVLENGRVVFR